VVIGSPLIFPARASLYRPFASLSSQISSGIFIKICKDQCVYVYVYQCFVHQIDLKFPKDYISLNASEFASKFHREREKPQQILLQEKVHDMHHDPSSRDILR